MENNETLDQTPELGGEQSFKNPCICKDIDNNDVEKLEEELNKRDETIIANGTYDIGSPVSTFEDFQELVMKSASLSPEAQTLADFINAKGPEFRLFFDTYVNTHGLSYPSNDLTNILNEALEGDNLINGYKYGDNESFMRTVPLSSKVDKKKQNTNANAVILAKFINNMGGGNTVTIPLWHSGFRVIINAPSVAELTTLHMQVVKNEIDLGRETLSLSTAANRSTSISVIKDFIRDRIFRTTLNVDLNSVDIFQYISILDFDSLLLGLLAATYVNKISTVRTCVNTIRGSDGSSLGCSHTVTGELDPYKLIVVDRRLLTKNMMNTISKTVPGTVTLAERENYISDLERNLNEIRNRNSVFRNNGNIVKFKIPSVNTFIQDGAVWVEEAMTEVQNLTAEMNARQKEIIAEKIKDVRGGTIMSANVESIGIEDLESPDSSEGAVYSSDRGTIYSALKKMTSDISVVNDFFVAVNEFVNRSYIAICATPNYVCPKCRKQQEGIKTPHDFDAYIPLNVLDFFLSLVEVKITTTQINMKATL